MKMPLPMQPGQDGPIPYVPSDETMDHWNGSDNAQDGVVENDIKGLIAGALTPRYNLTPLSSLPADRHPAKVYLKRLAAGSQPTMRNALNIIAEILTAGRCNWETMPWAALRAQHTKALRTDLAYRYAPATVNKMLAAVRGVLREAFELDLMTAEEYQRAISVRAVKGERLLRGRALRAGELRALFAVCRHDKTPAGARDGALLAVLYGSGLRRSEAVALDVGDYGREEESLRVRAGKGNRERMVYLAAGQGSLIDRWLAVRGSAAGPLFRAVAKGGKIQARRLSDRAVLYIVERRGKAAGLAHFSPHDLRRTMIGDLLDAGADISTVQKLAGHAQVTTTTRYDRRDEGSKKRAAGLLHIPSED